MTRHRKPKYQSNRKRKTNLRPPYFFNRNQQFEAVRKRMSMKTEGPTIDEMSNIDTTGNVVEGDVPKVATQRPVSTPAKIRNWWGDGGKQIIIGVGIAAITFILGSLVIHHGNHLTKHDKDIEYLQKSDNKQSEVIEQLKEKSSEMKTDIRLLEQRMDLTSGKPNNNTNAKTEVSPEPSKIKPE